MTVAFNDPKYALEPSDYRCTSCAAEIAAEAPFFSVIFFEGEIFRRRSYCTECWRKPPSDVSEAYAFWRSHRPAPHAPARRLRFDPDLVLEFFRRLSARPEAPLPGPSGEAGAAADAAAPAPTGGPEEAAGPSEKARLRLVIALLLIRRKYLVFESSAAREGREWLKLSEKADPEKLYLVENPPMTDAELEAVRISLGNLLQMDLG